jgi:hypothetical protein
MGNNFSPINSTIFVLFSKYCPIMDQLCSKDSSRDFQLNCIISYFFTYIYYFMHGPKIDMMEREWKNFNFWSASKQGLNKQKEGHDCRKASFSKETWGSPYSVCFFLFYFILWETTVSAFYNGWFPSLDFIGYGPELSFRWADSISNDGAIL